MFPVLGKRMCPLERTFSLQCCRTLRRRSIPYSIEDPYFSCVFSEFLSSARSSNETNYNWKTDSTEEPWSATPLHGKLHLHTFCRLCWRSTERCNVVVDRPHLCWASSVDAIVEDLKLKNSNTTADHEGRLFHFWCSLPKNSETQKSYLHYFCRPYRQPPESCAPLIPVRVGGFQLSCHATCKQRRVWSGASGQNVRRFWSKFFFLFSKKATRAATKSKER